MNRAVILQAMFVGKRLQIGDWKSKHNPRAILLQFLTDHCNTAEQPCAC